ncbi:MAG: DoxX family membrane protein [Odoribacteraceae bacterium]|jgi:uncharacterized membrane protein YphA (DoxX/SURF4 family)|nr:DoxX family membrane protein [Odoribacteraceae bacterium]
MPVTRNFCRLILALTFLYSGFVKGVDPLGSAYKFIEYFHAAGVNGIDPIAIIAAIALSLLEFTTGVALLLNLRARLAATIALLLATFFTPFTLFLAIFQPVNDCGCFGDALHLSPWQSFWKNTLLLILAIVVHAKRKRFTPTLSSWRQRLVLFITTMYMLLLSLHGYYNLPVIDFRPYASGKNIAATGQQAGEPRTGNYTITLYYKNKNTGEIKAFSASEYPWKDSSWVHERTEKSLHPGTKTSRHRDFHVDHPVNGDITTDILAANEYILLVAARNLDEITRAMQARVNRLAYYLQDKEYRVIGITPDTRANTSAFIQRYRVPYDLCAIDDAQLKTMIRANLGFLLLHRGTIIAKGAARDIPEVSDIRETTLVAYLLEKERKQRDRLLVATAILLLASTYLITRPARRVKHRGSRRHI